MLSLEQPDLVILSGDMVSGFAWDGRQGWFESHWRRLIQPLQAAGVPYASILGEWHVSLSVVIAWYSHRNA